METSISVSYTHLDVYKRQDKDTTEILKRKKATVLSLYEKFDWTSDTIAEKLNLEKSLVDAIINNKS